MRHVGQVKTAALDVGHPQVRDIHERRVALTLGIFGDAADDVCKFTEALPRPRRRQNGQVAVVDTGRCRQRGGGFSRGLPVLRGEQVSVESLEPDLGGRDDSGGHVEAGEVFFEDLDDAALLHPRRHRDRELGQRTLVDLEQHGSCL